MKKFKFSKCIYVLLLAVLLVVPGVTADAAPKKTATKKAAAAPVLGESFAAGASSRLLDGATIHFSAALPSVPTSDDGLLYLYDMWPAEYAVAPTAVPVAAVPLSTDVAVTVPYTANRLYQKLGLAVKVGGQNVLIASPQYISNPELLATHTKPVRGQTFNSVQGVNFHNLLIQAGSNIDGIIGGGYSTVQVISDDVLGANELYKSPLARAAAAAGDTRPGLHHRFMLNSMEPQGITAVTQLLTRCAAASSADNYIIGNEANVRKWNYVAWTDWDSYVREYAQVFRICYNAIKSQNANARVYVCIDQNWDRNRPASHPEYYEFIDGKDFLAKFNTIIKQSGNIDWNVSAHPHTVPLTYAKFWDMSGCPDGGYMSAQVNSGKMMTFQNISMLSNFLMTPEMLKADGTPRRIIFGELALASEQGSDVQAAALYAAYMSAKMNPLVDECIFYQANDPTSCDSRLQGQSQAIFSTLGTPADAQYDAWAKSVIGISDWSQVIK